MKIKVLFLVSGFLLTLNCTSQNATANLNSEMKDTQGTTVHNDKNQDGIIYLNEGEDKFFKEYEMNITFKTVSEDSRCPAGTNCIWPGVGVAEITVMGTYTRPQTLTLSTQTDTAKGYSNMVEFNGYIISLKDLSPYPTAERGSSKLQGSYKIGLQITKDKNPQGSLQR